MAAVLASGPTGCRKPIERVLTKEQREQIQEALLSAPGPDGASRAVVVEPQLPAGVILDGGEDGRIELLGIDLDAKEAKAGGTFYVTWYWKAHTDLKGAWKVFVHLDMKGKKRTVHDHQPVGELMPLSDLRAGDVIKDVQRIQVDDGFPSGTAKLYVGLFDEEAWSQRKENRRMQVVNRDSVEVPVDKEGRVAAGSLKIIGKPKTGKGKGTGKGKSKGEAEGKDDKRPRRYVVHKAPVAPTVDGRMDEAAWKRAASTGSFVSPHGKTLGGARVTMARLLWTDDALYVGMTCKDSDIYNDQEGRDATLWEQDVVEVYLDPGSDGKDYLELQVSPTGEIFDAWFSSHRKPHWKESSARFDIKGLEAEVFVQGTVNAREDEVADKQWSVEIAIPWSDLPGAGPEAKAPKAGTRWAANLYRIDGGSPGNRGFHGAWAPAGGDFHNTKEFGTLVFDAKPMAVKLQAPPPVAAPAIEATRILQGGASRMLPRKRGGTPSAPKGARGERAMEPKVAPPPGGAGGPK